MKSYFHLDMDAFFVSVEELFDPTLKGKPVVVGGKHNERGVVSAASYAARKFGVHSAMPLRTAYRLCPQALFVEGHRERYSEYSRKVHNVLQTFSPAIEMASIDEAYLDMTGTEKLHGPPLLAAHKLLQAVKNATDLRGYPKLGARRIDACYRQPRAPLRIRWGDVELTMRSSPNVTHAVVYTPEHAVCLEPQTCAPDAFNLAAQGVEGAGMVVVDERHPLVATTTWRWTISA